MKNKDLQLGIYIFFIIRGIYYFIFENINISITSLISIFLLSTFLLMIFIHIKEKNIYKYILLPIFVLILILSINKVTNFISYIYLPKYPITIVYISIFILLFYIVKEQKIVFIRTIEIYFFISIIIYLLIVSNLIYKINISTVLNNIKTYSLKDIIYYSVILSFLTRIYLIFFEKIKIQESKLTIIISFILTNISIVIERIIEVSTLSKYYLLSNYSYIKVLESINFYNLIDKCDKIFGFIYLLDGITLILSTAYIIKMITKRKKN